MRQARSVGSMVGNPFPRSMTVSANIIVSIRQPDDLTSGRIGRRTPSHPAVTSTHLVLIPSYNTGARLFPTVATIRTQGMAGLGCHRWQYRRDRPGTCPHGHERPGSACLRSAAQSGQRRRDSAWATTGPCAWLHACRDRGCGRSAFRRSYRDARRTVARTSARQWCLACQCSTRARPPNVF